MRSGGRGRGTTVLSMTVRVVLVDDHEMVIEGLKAMLAPFGDRVEVVGRRSGPRRPWP